MPVSGVWVGSSNILYPPSNPGKVCLILLREQRAKRAFFRSDLEVVHIHNKCGKQGEGCQVRQASRRLPLKLCIIGFDLFLFYNLLTPFLS